MVYIRSIIDHLFGSRCQLCAAAANGLCTACRAALPRNLHACPVCALPLPPSAPTRLPCAACQRQRPSFASAVVPLLYRSPVDDLVAGLKYHQRLQLAAPLADCLADAVTADRRETHTSWPAVVVPVPMHPQHLRQRGFNQATELARWLARRLGLRLSTRLLRRTGAARHQRGLKRRERLRYPAGGFVASAACPAHIAVVDDVVTTGATAEQVSRALLRAGAAKVEIWAVARTPGQS